MNNSASQESVSASALRPSHNALKRLFDIGLALVSGVMLSLPMVVVALLVKLTSPGPVLYWSDRVGKNNQIFSLPKFRSMSVGTKQTMQHLVAADSITPLGHYLRKWSLDELPQLWCILKGDMSFVGPRPVLPKEEVFVAMRTLRKAHEIKPGLTGWAQINGRAEIKLSEKLDLDVYYLENQSFWLDLKIIFLTAFKVIRKEGIVHSDGSS